METQALIQALKRSISEVLEAMFYLPVEFSDTTAAGGLPYSAMERMSATRLKFSGPFSGAFILFVPEEFGTMLAANFLGNDKENISPQNVTETSKEILNMMAGNTFAILDDQAVFDLSFPETLILDEALRSFVCADEIVVRTDVLDGHIFLKLAINR